MLGFAVCTPCLVNSYMLPRRPLFKKKKNSFFRAKPSYCLQVGAENREGTAQMSEKCQMPAGSVQFIFPSEMFTPGKRVPAWGGMCRSMAPAVNQTGAKAV